MGVPKEFKLEMLQRAAASATGYLNSCVRLVAMPSKHEELVADIISFKREVVQQKVGVSASDIPVVALLNWSAPSSIPATLWDKQSQVFTWVLHENIQSCGAAVLPVYAGGKGKLHLEETKALSALSQGSHNCDMSFAILFKDQADSRDARPMVYPGKIVFPAPLVDFSKNPFHACRLRKDRRTVEVPQVPTKNLKIIEDCSSKCFLLWDLFWRVGSEFQM